MPEPDLSNLSPDELEATVAADPAVGKPEWTSADSPEPAQLGARVEDFLKTHALAGKSWEDTASHFRQRFPDLDPAPLKDDFPRYGHQARLDIARRDVAKDYPEESGARWALRQAVAPVREPITAILYGRAKKRFDEGSPEPGDYRTIAIYEQEKARDAQQSAAADVVAPVLGVPAHVASFAAGGQLLRGAAGVAPRALGWLAPEVAGGAAATGLRGMAQATGRVAAQTLATPDLYLQHAVQANVQAGRDPLDVKGFPGAVGLGMAQLAVLGAVGKLTGGLVEGTGLGPAAGRVAVQAASGPVAQAATDFVTSALGLDAGYGTIGRLTRGELGDALKHAAIDALTFASFGIAHELGRGGERPGETLLSRVSEQAGPRMLPAHETGAELQPAVERITTGPAPETPRPPEQVLRSFADALAHLHRQGFGADAAGQRLRGVYDRIAAELNLNPDLTREGARKLFEQERPGPLRAFALSLADTLPAGEPERPMLPAKPPEFSDANAGPRADLTRRLVGQGLLPETAARHAARSYPPRLVRNAPQTGRAEQPARPAQAREPAVPPGEEIRWQQPIGPDEPPVAPGMIRMYHGGILGGDGSRWLTADRRYAEGYADKNLGQGAEVGYVDLPRNSPLLKKAYDDTGTSSPAPPVHFEAPPEIAARIKPLQPRPAQPLQPDQRQNASESLITAPAAQGGPEASPAAPTQPQGQPAAPAPEQVATWRAALKAIGLPSGKWPDAKVATEAKRLGIDRMTERGEPAPQPSPSPGPPGGVERRQPGRPPQGVWEHIRAEHPDWTVEQIGREAARRADELMVDPQTGLGSRAQFGTDAAQHGKFTTIFDVPSMHAVNNTWGDNAGDALLAAHGAAMREAGITRGYRKGGDELAALFDSAEEQRAKSERYHDILQNTTVTWEDANGHKVRVKGFGAAISHGDTPQQAQARLPAAKEAARAAGLRGPNSETLPPRLTVETSGGGPPPGRAPERPGAPGHPAPQRENLPGGGAQPPGAAPVLRGGGTGLRAGAAAAAGEGAARAAAGESARPPAAAGRRAAAAHELTPDQRLWGRKALEAGLDPKDLHALAADLRGNGQESAGEHNAVLRELRDQLAEFSGKAKLIGTGRIEDADALPGADEAGTWLERTHPGLIRPDENPSDAVYRLLRAGNRPKLTEKEAYERAFEHLAELKRDEAAGAGEPTEIEPGVYFSKPITPNPEVLALREKQRRGLRVSPEEIIKAARLSAKEEHVFRERVLRNRSFAEIAKDPVMLKEDGSPPSKQALQQIESRARARMGIAASTERSTIANERAARAEEFAERAGRAEKGDLSFTAEEAGPKYQRKLTAVEEARDALDKLTTKLLKEIEDAGERGLSAERREWFRQEATRLDQIARRQAPPSGQEAAGAAGEAQDVLFAPPGQTPAGQPAGGRHRIFDLIDAQERAGKPIGPFEVIATMRRLFGLPAYVEGRLQANATALYRLKPEAAEVNKMAAGAAPVYVHELAHHIAKAEGLDLDPASLPAAVARGLTAFDYQPGRASRHTAMQEGFAEWLRRRETGQLQGLTPDQKAAADYAEKLIEARPAVKDKLDRVRDLFTRLGQQSPARQFGGHISTTGEPARPEVRPGEAAADFLRRSAQAANENLLDDVAAARRAERAAVTRGEPFAPGTKLSEVLATTRLRNVPDALEMEQGGVFAYDRDGRHTRLSVPLKEAVKGLTAAEAAPGGDLDRLMHALRVQHDLESGAVKRSPEQAEGARAVLRELLSTEPGKARRLIDAADKVTGLFNATLDALALSGRITAEKAKLLKDLHPFYVSEQHVTEPDFHSVPPYGGRRLGEEPRVAGFLKRRSGSGEQMVNWLDALRDRYRFTAAAVNDQMKFKALLDLSKREGVGQWLNPGEPGAGPAGEPKGWPRDGTKPSITGYVDGQPVRVRVNDKAFYELVTGSQGADSDVHGLLRFLGNVTQALRVPQAVRTGATILSPLWHLKNFVRDPILYAQRTVADRGPVGNLAELFRWYGKSIDFYARSLLAGGADNVEVRRESDRYFQLMERMAGRELGWGAVSGEKTFGSRVMDGWHGLFQRLSDLLTAGEKGTRVLELKNVLDRLGWTKERIAAELKKDPAQRNPIPFADQVAALDVASQITHNVHQMGSLVRQLNRSWPFLGAHIAGVYKDLTTFAKQPQKVAGALAILAAAKAVEFLVNKDDPEWNELPDHYRFGFSFKTPLGWMHFPAPRGLTGVITGMMDYATRALGRNNPRFAQLLGQALEEVAPHGGPEPLRTAFNVATNRNWMGRPIIPDREADRMGIGERFTDPRMLKYQAAQATGGLVDPRRLSLNPFAMDPHPHQSVFDLKDALNAAELAHAKASAAAHRQGRPARAPAELTRLREADAKVRKLEAEYRREGTPEPRRADIRRQQVELARRALLGR